MLARPNTKEVIPKVGNRYQSVLAISKRARQLEAERTKKRAECKDKDCKECKELTEECMFDAVDRAAKEIAEGKVYIKINGEYAVTPESEMEKEIEELQKAAMEKQIKE